MTHLLLTHRVGLLGFALALLATLPKLDQRRTPTAAPLNGLDATLHLCRHHGVPRSTSN